MGEVPPPLLVWDALLRSERLGISSSGSSSSEREALGARLTWDMGNGLLRIGWECF